MASSPFDEALSRSFEMEQDRPKPKAKWFLRRLSSAGSPFSSFSSASSKQNRSGVNTEQEQQQEEALHQHQYEQKRPLLSHDDNNDEEQKEEQEEGTMKDRGSPGHKSPPQELFLEMETIDLETGMLVERRESIADINQSMHQIKTIQQGEIGNVGWR